MVILKMFFRKEYTNVFDPIDPFAELLSEREPA